MNLFDNEKLVLKAKSDHNIEFLWKGSTGDTSIFTVSTFHVSKKLSIIL